MRKKKGKIDFLTFARGGFLLSVIPEGDKFTVCITMCKKFDSTDVIHIIEDLEEHGWKTG
jgi:hypothetical protein